MPRVSQLSQSRMICFSSLLGLIAKPAFLTVISYSKSVKMVSGMAVSSDQSNFLLDPTSARLDQPAGTVSASVRQQSSSRAAPSSPVVLHPEPFVVQVALQIANTYTTEMHRVSLRAFKHFHTSFEVILFGSRET